MFPLSAAYDFARYIVTLLVLSLLCGMELSTCSTCNHQMADPTLLVNVLFRFSFLVEGRGGGGRGEGEEGGGGANNCRLQAGKENQEEVLNTTLLYSRE